MYISGPVWNSAEPVTERVEMSGLALPGIITENSTFSCTRHSFGTKRSSLTVDQFTSENLMLTTRA